MYTEIINYKLAENIAEEHLLKVASQVTKEWMSKQPGFIRWEINKDDEGNYIDIVYWKSKEDAKKAEADMINIPNAGDWFNCYEKGSISSKKLTKIKSFE